MLVTLHGVEIMMISSWKLAQEMKYAGTSAFMFSGPHHFPNPLPMHFVAEFCTYLDAGGAG
jgi:hypothetical protein